MEDYNLGWSEGVQYAKEQFIELVKSQEFQQAWINAPISMTFAEFCEEQVKEYFAATNILHMI